MVVIVLTDCPAKLKGDLSKWFFEINTGVYVGNVSVRVRNYIWERICENIAYGQATMVFSASGEQKMDFRVHNTTWKIIDYDGLKLMQRPDASKRELSSSFLKDGFSKAAHYRKAENIKRKALLQREVYSRYIVINITGNGNSILSGQLQNFAYLQIENGKIRQKDYFAVNADTKCNNTEIKAHLQQFLDMLGDDSIVCENALFQINALQSLLKKYDLKMGKNKVTDIRIMAKRKLKNYCSDKSEYMAALLHIPEINNDEFQIVQTIFQVYSKLNEI